MNKEDYIVHNLVTNSDFLGKVITKLKPEYFEEYLPQSLHYYIDKCIKDDSPVSFDTLKLMIHGDFKLNQRDGADEILKYIGELEKQTINISMPILMQETEKWAKINSFKHGLNKSIDLIKKNQTTDSYRQALGIIEESFNVSFEDDIYSMTWNNNEDRLKRIRTLKMENAIMSGFKPFDDLTGGIKRKTLTCFLAPTNMGKTLSMAFLAACFAKQGLNVAIATLEISCEEYLQRIDANILNLGTYDMQVAGENVVMKEFDIFDNANPNMGQIEIHQFSDATVIDTKMWLKELYTTKNFVPDILIIDYIGIMSALNVKDRSNPYIIMKEISREVRQKIGIDMDLPIISAVQSNRKAEHKVKTKGAGADIGNDDVGDSYAIPQNLDTFISQIEIRNNIQQYLTNDISSVYMWKLIKSRSHVETGTRTMVGVSKNKQRLYDINFGNVDLQIINNQESQTPQELKEKAKEIQQKEDDWYVSNIM